MGMLPFFPVFIKCLTALPLTHLLHLAWLFRYEKVTRFGGAYRVNTFFPPYPSPAFSTFLDNVVHRRRIPFSTYIAVTSECPYTCEHCSYGNRRRFTPETDSLIELIGNIIQLGCPTIGLTGGEPMLRNDIANLIKAIAPNAGSIIFTTGYGLTREKANELRDAGLDSVMIGLESDDENTHDTIRGVPGSYKAGISAIEAALHAGLYTGISTIGTHKKIALKTLDGLASLAKRMGIHEFRILEPIPTGGHFGRQDTLLSAEDSEHLVRFHKSQNRKPGPSICAFSYYESAQMFGCGAGYSHAFVDAAGNVCPCDLTPFSFGNVNRSSFSEIWDDMGQWFGLPRRNCIMKEICSKTEITCSELPVPANLSRELLSEAVKAGELPDIFKRYLR